GGGEGVERADVTGELGVDPAGAEVEDLLRGLGRGHGVPPLVDPIPCPWRYICAGLWPASWPPSIGTVAPVTYDDCSEHSQSTTSATSGVVPTRPMGTEAAASRCASPPARARWWVRIGPGATTLTRMPWSA